MDKIAQTTKVLDWAKDRNDFFCVHELASFFNNEDPAKLSATVGKLTQLGKLTKTDIKKDCKFQTKKHSYWIYNKEKVMQPLAKMQEAAEKAPRIKGFHNKIRESIAKQTGQFCSHTIAKDVGSKDIHRTQKYLSAFVSRKQMRMVGRKNCPDGIKTHQFFEYDGKKLGSVKRVIKHQGKRIKTRLSKPKNGYIQEIVTTQIQNKTIQIPIKLIIEVRVEQ